MAKVEQSISINQSNQQHFSCVDLTPQLIVVMLVVTKGLPWTMAKVEQCLSINQSNQQHFISVDLTPQLIVVMIGRDEMPALDHGQGRRMHLDNSIKPAAFQLCGSDATAKLG
jgi:hypothetical protein